MMLSESFWREEMNGETTGWATFTIGVILLVIIRHLVIATTSRFRSTFSPLSLNRSDVASPKQSINPIVSQSPISHNRISSMVSDLELKTFIDNLDEKLQDKEKWDNVVERSNNLISYYAKCCKPKNGPLKYLSVTIFEDCDSELLRDFYMDNDYRKQWDKTVVAHEQLEVDKSSGTEVGRTIKKFPLLTSREYVLAWRLWDGNDGTYYCFTKECEHPLAPRQKKYVRVRFLRSGWRIRKVRADIWSEKIMLHPSTRKNMKT